MTWSMRSAPACRSTRADHVAERRVARTRRARRGATAAATSPGPAGCTCPAVRPPSTPGEYVARSAQAVGPVRVHADGEVVHDAERHAARPARPAARRELLVGDPLQPAVEVDALGELRSRSSATSARGRCPSASSGQARGRRSAPSSAHHRAKSSRPGPARSRNASKAALPSGRARARRRSTSSADRLAVQAASRSMRARVGVRARGTVSARPLDERALGGGQVGGLADVLGRGCRAG